MIQPMAAPPPGFPAAPPTIPPAPPPTAPPPHPPPPPRPPPPPPTTAQRAWSLPDQAPKGSADTRIAPIPLKQAARIRQIGAAISYVSVQIGIPGCERQ